MSTRTCAQTSSSGVARPTPKPVAAGDPLQQLGSAQALAAANSGRFLNPATGVVTIKTARVPLSQELTMTIQH